MVSLFCCRIIIIEGDCRLLKDYWHILADDMKEKSCMFFFHIFLTSIFYDAYTIVL
ncbi:hypothetical protein HMPREF0663_11717 [Hoylesella oralis ATCC 33269]|uniref:Uncharacterized protein n=1 Tax=Hoylesella oralis ATCC 33269 TaxID=873533 RepID=E7RRB6_9BACT|nr:hypothetical protein HMPREF0663_11717 [Hoylesella oralis ATCC 33269]